MTKRQHINLADEKASTTKKQRSKNSRSTKSEISDDDQSSNSKLDDTSKMQSTSEARGGQKHSSCREPRKSTARAQLSRKPPKKEKSKNKLRQEGVQARKDKKAAEEQNEYNTQELKKAQKQLELYRSRISELVKEKNDALNKEKTLMLEDRDIRQKLTDLFLGCRDWAAIYTCREAMVDHLSDKSLNRLLSFVSEDCQGSRACFLSRDGAVAIRHIKCGARLLLEGILIHMIIDEVLMQPLRAFDGLIGLSSGQASYGTVLDEFNNMVRKNSSDDARLFEAHCVRLIASLIPNLEPQRDYLVSRSFPQQLIHDKILPLAACLMNDTYHDDVEAALDELEDLFIKARKISLEVWSCNVYVDTWGNNAAALSHSHVDTDAIEFHPMMQTWADNNEHNGEKFQMFTQPVIRSHDIGGDRNSRTWAPAIGVIFPDMAWEAKENKRHNKQDITTDQDLKTTQPQIFTKEKSPVALSSCHRGIEDPNFVGQSTQYRFCKVESADATQSPVDYSNRALNGIMCFADEPAIDPPIDHHTQSLKLKTSFCSANSSNGDSLLTTSVEKESTEPEQKFNDGSHLNCNGKPSKVCSNDPSDIIDLTQ